jgi:hypothetical protein
MALLQDQSSASVCVRSHRSNTETMCTCCTALSGCPLSISCHFSMQPRQHVAVACCAMNTGCPRHGVCLPSLDGWAGPRRFAMKSRACSRIVGSPFWRRYSRSAKPSRNRRRNAERSSAWNKSSGSRMPLVNRWQRHATHHTLGARRPQSKVAIAQPGIHPETVSVALPSRASLIRWACKERRATGWSRSETSS